MRIHHLGIAVPNIDDAVASHRVLFGAVTVSETYLDPIQKVAVCFVSQQSAETMLVEFIAPSAHDSPVLRTLEKGLGAYHIGYEVSDLNAALDDLRSKKCLLISGPVPAVAFGGRKIAWLYTPTRQLIELIEDESN